MQKLFINEWMNEWNKRTKATDPTNFGLSMDLPKWVVTKRESISWKRARQRTESHIDRAALCIKPNRNGSANQIMKGSYLVGTGAKCRQRCWAPTCEPWCPACWWASRGSTSHCLLVFIVHEKRGETKKKNQKTFVLSTVPCNRENSGKRCCCCCCSLTERCSQWWCVDWGALSLRHGTNGVVERVATAWCRSDGTTTAVGAAKVARRVTPATSIVTALSRVLLLMIRHETRQRVRGSAVVTAAATGGRSSNRPDVWQELVVL